MFEHLNVKTRHLVKQLCTGEPIVLGGASVGILEEGARKLLAVLAGHLNDLQDVKGQDLKGQDLVSKVQQLCSAFDFVQ